MCDEHDTSAHGPGLSRRRLLQGMVALAAVAGLGGGPTSAAAAPLPPRASNLAGQNAYAMAMHLHASASEGAGSVGSQLAQAALNGFDVAWFTDHDWRRHRLLFRQSYSFIANEVQFGGTWNVPRIANTGSLAAGSGGTLVTSPVTATDPATRKGSLRLRATSTGTALASVRHRIAAEGSSRANFRGRIAGRTLSVDVLPAKAGPDAWGAILLRLSHHPATAGRPAGVYTLLYRLRSDVSARATSNSGVAGFVDVPVIRGSWQTVTLDPVADAAAIWPDVEAVDNSLTEIEFHGVSRRRAAGEHFFGYLRFVEAAGYDPVGVETALLQKYAGTSGVLGLDGTEISLAQHLNQYGGPQEPFGYGPVTSLRDNLGDLRTAIVQHIHGLGGLASINHPFQAGDSGGQGTVAGVARDLLAIGAAGADMIEIGYANRYGGDLAEHLAVWDTLSRNGLVLTANGVSDDHTGQNWAGQVNRFYTAAWAAARTEADLLDALGRGRGYVGHLGSFGGTIDMLVDGTAPMGSVVVGPPRDRTLRMDATGLPTGGAVQLVRGIVDHAGVGTPAPNSAVVATRGATALANDPEWILPAGDDCFVRLQVVNASGAVVAFGQPIWAFADLPLGVAANRLVAG